MRSLQGTVFILAVVLFAPQAQAWESGTLRLRGRLQTRFEVEEWTARDGSETQWVSSFHIRRARIDGRWDPTDWARLVLEFEGAGGFALTDRYGNDGESIDVQREAGIELKDAYSQFVAGECLRFRVGRFKKPFSRLRMESPFRLLVPARGLLNRYAVNNTRYGGYGGRDVGVQISGRFKNLARLTYDVGVFSGPRFNDLNETSTKDYVARVQVRPFKGLRVAINASHKVYHYKNAPGDLDLGLERGVAYTGNLFGADLRYKLGDLTVLLEGAYGDNLDLGPGHQLWGAHATVAYAIALGDELILTPAFMAEVFELDLDDELDPVLRFAGAVHLEIGEILRLSVLAEGATGELREWEPEERAFVIQTPPTRVYLQAQVSF